MKSSPTEWDQIEVIEVKVAHYGLKKVIFTSNRSLINHKDWVIRMKDGVIYKIADYIGLEQCPYCWTFGGDISCPCNKIYRCSNCGDNRNIHVSNGCKKTSKCLMCKRYSAQIDKQHVTNDLQCPTLSAAITLKKCFHWKHIPLSE